MDTKNLRSTLRQMADEAKNGKLYRGMGFSVFDGKTPNHSKSVTVKLLNRDFVLGDKDWFTFEEAKLIEDVGREFGLRIPTAHEWRGIGFWVTHDDIYAGETKFNFRHNGYRWEGTDFKQDMSVAYYWTGSEDFSADKSTKTTESEKARAVKIAVGQFNILSRPKTEGMNLRLMYDDSLV